MEPSVSRRSAAKSLLDVALIVAAALGLAFVIQALIVKPYKIPSGSMEPTLAIGQRILVDRIGMDFTQPSVGSITVFHPPASSEAMLCGPVPHSVTPGGAACDHPVPREGTVTYVKRIVAGPGDEIFVREGHVYRMAAGTSHFVRENDPYIKATCAGSGAPSECSFPIPIKIPPGHWFMMGDNRGNSDDSRFWGPIPTGWIIGQAFATYWPPDRIGTL